MDSREEAYLCLIGQEGYLEDRLRLSENRAPLTYALARGTVKMRRALDFLALQLTKEGRLPKKKREIELFRLCLFQHFYLEKIPLFALVDEGVKLAKKYTSPHFAKFLNASLRRLETHTLTLPIGNDPESVAIRLSYPIHFVKKMVKLPYGVASLEAMNQPPRLFARKMGTFDALEIEGADVNRFTASSEYYIQDKTPIALMQALSLGIEKAPRTILDLASSPGGKLLLASDLFPKASLTANDITEEKLAKLGENLERFGKVAKLTCFPAENYPLNEQFDLVIADLPCSNSGVLGRRAEARWRLDQEGNLSDIQFSILKRAKDLLSPNGELWYLTCSILPEENERMAERVTKELGLAIKMPNLTRYPQNGEDGGFAVSFKRV